MKFLGIVDDVQKLATPIPTMRAYKLPGGIVPVKTWDLVEKKDVIWPDRPFVSTEREVSVKLIVFRQTVHVLVNLSWKASSGDI